VYNKLHKTERQTSALKRWGCWGRASCSAPAYPKGKQQMLPGYSKSAICYADLVREVLRQPNLINDRNPDLVQAGVSETGNFEAQRMVTSKGALHLP
jgi:hypothetical protein